MSTTYQVRAKDGFQTLTGHTLKLGKGKNAVEVLGIGKWGTTTDSHYSIDHLPTLLTLVGGFPYQSLAKDVAKTILGYMGEKLLHNINITSFDQELIDFCLFWKRAGIERQCKHAPTTWEEWTGGTDYERLHVGADHGAVSSPQSPEHTEELLSRDETLAWVPSPYGTMDQRDLTALIEGRRAPSEVFSPNTEK